MKTAVERATKAIYYKPSDAPLSVVAQQAVKKLFFVANSFLHNNQEYLFGSWSIVDVELSLMLQRLILNGDVVPKNLMHYAKKHWARPSVQKWVNIKRPAL